MPERDIRKELKKRVEEYGGEVRALAWLGRRNAPDVLCLFPPNSVGAQRIQWLRQPWDVEGQHPLVETKAPGGRPTAAQAREHERLRAAGCVVKVISTIGQLNTWLPPRA